MDLKDVANSAKSDSNHDLVGVDCISPAAKLAKQLRCFKANKTAGLALDAGNAIISAMSSTSDVVYAGRDSPSEFANVASASDTNKTANRTRKRRGKAILKRSSKLASVTANTVYLREAGFNALSSGCSPTEFTDVVDKPDTRSRRNRGKTGVRKKHEQSQSVAVCSKGSKHHDDSGSDSSSKNTGTPSQVEKKGATRKRTAREKTENSAGKIVPRKAAKLSVVDSDKKKTFRKQKQSVSCNGKKQTKVTREHSATPGTDREAAPMGEGSCLVPSAGAGASGDAPEASSESESEWEEVDELPGSNLSVRDQVPTAPVEIVLEGPLLKRGKKHQHKLDVKTYFRRLMNRYKKETQLDMHKVHLLCLLSYGFHRNDMCNDVMLKAVALSILPARFTDIGDWDISVLGKLTGWFRDHFIVNSPLPGNTAHLVATLISGVTQGHVSSHTELVFVFLAMLRSLGLDVRLVISLQPLPLKPIDLEMKTCSENKKKAADSGQTKNKSVTKVLKKESLVRKGCSEMISKEDAHMRTNVEIKQESDKGEETRQVGVTLSAKISRKCKLKKVKKNAEWEKEERESLDKDIQQDVTASVLVKSTGQVTKQDSGRPRRRGSKVNYAESRQEEREETEERSSTPGDRGEVEKELRLDGGKRKGTGRETREGDQSSADDDDFVEETMKVRVVSKARKPTRTKREVAASDDDDNVTLKDDDSGMNHWTEVFLPRQQCWICVDCVRARVAEPDKIERWATSPICYVLGFDNRNFVKDITSRYAYDWMHTTRKQRVSPEWWQAVLAPYCSPNMEQDRRENEELKAKFTKEPLPTVIGQYKNHPLYALKRHLLKFEAIYPPTALILGYVRGEPVYPRECVCNLHSRETWLKEGLVVKIGEEPYKMVKARPKWRKPHENTTDPTLPIFGRWQTEMYVAPPAVDGKVPVNEYGNVELFQASMLPAGTVHIRVPGLQKVAKKLNIDCPPAMVGWDFHGGFNHPVMDGWVVCVEHREILLVAWDEDQEIQRQRDIEKREARATGNWKLLVKGLLIRQRLRCRYDLQETAPGSVGKTDKRRLEHDQRPARDTALAWPQNRKQAQPNDKSQNRGPLFPFEMEHM